MALQKFTMENAPNHIAQALLRSGLSIPKLRALSPLEENAQKLVDKAVIEVGLERLVVADDLIAANTFPLADPLSVMEVQWEMVSKTGGAQRTMAPNARGEFQMPDRKILRVPVYITTDDFSVNIRTLKMSERIGTPLDVSLVKSATRRVNEAIEDSVLNGAGLQVDGYTAPGILNETAVNTYAYKSNLAWDDPTKVGDDIILDVVGMINKLQADKKYGPYNLYVPTLYGIRLMEDYKTYSDITVQQRLEQISVGGRNLVVRTADQLPVNKTVLLQPTDDVVDVIVGQSPVTVPWTSLDGFVLYWMVMAIIIPRVKHDYDGNSGIVVGYPT